MKRLFEDVINRIPDYKTFLTVDEMDESSKKLAEAYPHVVELFEIGRTRNNHPIYCLKIGNGSDNALMFGCPHPNEPIGAMLLEYFSWELAENRELREKLDYTWYIIKTWDVDGTKLNENWFKGPFTLYNYARNFFRPAGHQQVDWTFPIDYKNLHFHDTIPETKAMMNLINQIRPKFIYSLHNAGFGGVYWYLTREAPEIYEDLKNAAKKQGIPLNLGEPEAPYCEALAPAIYKNLGIKQHLMVNCNTKSEMDAIELALKDLPVDIVFTGAFGIDENTGDILDDKFSAILGDLTGHMSYVNTQVNFEAIKKLMERGIDIAISSCGDNVASGKESLLWNAILCYKNGLDAEDVLRMITSIPAKILRIDNKVGSIGIGKDADIVIWSDNPIKTYAAKVEAVFINGENILHSRRYNTCWS